MDWRHRAVCKDEDPELFFPVGTRGLHVEQQVRAAKAVCARCPVSTQCLTWALESGQVGIWGGTTDEDRVEMRRRAAQRRARTA